MHIADAIPLYPSVPVAFKSAVAISRVAIAIPDTGLLEEPTSPTMRLDTVAKKKPNITIIRAPRKLIGTDGIIHIIIAITSAPPITKGIGRSLLVRMLSASLCPNPVIALRNVFIIVGSVFIRLIIPPAATAPAPI